MAEHKGVENSRVTPPHDPDDRYEAPEYPGGDEEQSADARKKLAQLQEWYQQAREGQNENRQQQEIDADFYDGLQWTQEDINELQARGQPAFVFNHIKPAVDWIIGTERKTRTDFKVYPRNEEDVEAAQVKGKLLKYITDINDGEYVRSRAFKDAVRVGVGWMEDGVRDDFSKDPIHTSYESWRNVLYDPLHREKDLSDARFLFRSRWTDKDIAMRMFPEHEEAIRRAAENVHKPFRRDEEAEDDFLRVMAEHHEQELESTVGYDSAITAEAGAPGNNRERVHLIECWYREPAKVQIMRGYNFALEGEEYDPDNETHREAYNSGEIGLRNTVRMTMRVAIFTGDLLLSDQRSPYKHNDFPFTPIWGWRRDRDNAPYGVIRNSRDPQEDMNKRASKAQHILASNQIIADKNAVDDWNELIDQANRPDGVIRGRNLDQNRLEFVSDRDLAAEHLQLMQQDQMFIQNTSGVTDENMGRETNAQSGRAIEARQEQGAAVTFELFDNLRLAMQKQGEKQLALVEQFYDMPRKIRVTGTKGVSEWIEINQPERGQDGQVQFRNDMAATDSEFVVDQQDFNTSARQAMFEQMMELGSKLPAEITLNMLDLIVDLSDVPNREEIVQRIRKVNGQLGPEDEADPELKRQQQAKAAEAERDKEIERQTKLAEIQEKLAGAMQDRIEGQNSAREVADKLTENPEMAPVIDAILGSAGYQESGHDLYETLQGRAPQEPDPEPEDAGFRDGPGQPPEASGQDQQPAGEAPGQGVPPPEPGQTAPPTGQPNPDINEQNQGS